METVLAVIVVAIALTANTYLHTRGNVNKPVEQSRRFVPEEEPELDSEALEAEKQRIRDEEKNLEGLKKMSKMTVNMQLEAIGKRRRKEE